MKSIDQKFDTIVVGTGPGGATVARELSRKGKKVLILERGGNPKLRGSLWQYILYQCIPFKSLLFTPGFIGVVRGLITGGSSIFYYATCFEVPFAMLRSYGVEIEDEVNELRRELPVGPLKDEVMGAKAKLIMKSARELNYDWKKLDKFMYQDKLDSNQRFANFYYGDPEGVKWSANMFVEEAVKDGATLITGAYVRRVIIDNGQATGVEFKKRGRKHKAFASQVVIAGGGIGSPVILRKSGIKEAGYNYFFDPLISVVGYVKDVKDENEFAMAAGVHMKDEGYVMTDMALPKMLNTTFAASAFRFGKMFSHKQAVRIMVKAKDTLGGRLTNRGGVRKILIREDKDKLMKGYRRAKEILKNAGAKDIYHTWYLAAHPGGTVKIGELVDADLKTKFDNLYVCDCSVIPEAWGLPPTQTIIGLGKRLAKHLLSKDQQTANRREKIAL
jgi:choline dehydrogenase-like flavoprotein